jgi:hypothetical protein
MQNADYKNKKLKAEDIKEAIVQKQAFVFPNYGIVIEAETMSEAEDLLKKQLTKTN